MKVWEHAVRRQAVGVSEVGKIESLLGSTCCQLSTGLQRLTRRGVKSPSSCVAVVGNIFLKRGSSRWGLNADTSRRKQNDSLCLFLSRPSGEDMLNLFAI